MKEILKKYSNLTKEILIKENGLKEVLSIIISAVICYLFFNEHIMSKELFTFMGRTIDYGAFLFSILIMFFIFFLIYKYIKKIQKEINLKNEYIKENSLKIKEELQILQEREIEIGRIKKALNTPLLEDEGNKIFNLAMGLDTYEPVKYSMLEEAATKHRHAFAGIYLGNLYYSGLKKGDKVIVKQNYELAFNMYMKAIEKDISGVAFWSLGWMYEHGQAPNSLTDDLKSQKKAYDCYIQSSKLGYAKAHNSLGRFYDKGYAGLSYDSTRVANHFLLADEGGDIYGTLNLAYTYSKNKEYENAATCFKKAIKKGSPLAYLKFADFLLENFVQLKEININEYSYRDILFLYCEAIKLNNSDVSAKAYYHIGQLLNDNRNEFCRYKDEIVTALSLEDLIDIEKQCNLRAYEILKCAEEQKITFEKPTEELYAKLKQYFDEFEQDKEKSWVDEPNA